MKNSFQSGKVAAALCRRQGAGQKALPPANQCPGDRHKKSRPKPAGEGLKSAGFAGLRRRGDRMSGRAVTMTMVFAVVVSSTLTMASLARAVALGGQLIKCFLLAGAQAGVERARGLIPLFGLGSALFAQLLRKVQALGSGQLAQVRALTGSLGAWLRRDGLGILIPGGLLVGLNLQKCFHAFGTIGLKLGKVHGFTAWAMVGRCVGRGSSRALSGCWLGMGAERERAQQSGGGNGGGQSALEEGHIKLLEVRVVLQGHGEIAVSMEASLRSLCKRFVRLCCCCVK
jgi:hypothetical protein